MSRYVLIVEDDEDCAHMLALWLSMEGYEVSEARNGLAALDAFRGRRPCLVLLDLMMPIMNGFEFRREQLKDPTLAGVPVVCVSAAVDALKIAGDMKLRCLTKPLSLDDVTE